LLNDWPLTQRHLSDLFFQQATGNYILHDCCWFQDPTVIFNQIGNMVS
jgi:hypothetical protein